MALSPMDLAYRNKFRTRIHWHLGQIEKLKECLKFKRCPVCGKRFQPTRLDQICDMVTCSVKRYRRDKR